MMCTTTIQNTWHVLSVQCLNCYICTNSASSTSLLGPTYIKLSSTVKCVQCRLPNNLSNTRRTQIRAHIHSHIKLLSHMQSCPQDISHSDFLTACLAFELHEEKCAWYHVIPPLILKFPYIGHAWTLYVWVFDKGYLQAQSVGHMEQTWYVWYGTGLVCLVNYSWLLVGSLAGDPIRPC